MSIINRSGWNHKIHSLWLSGEHRQAIEKMAEEIHRYGEVKPKTVILQTCYYLFLVNDYRSCIKLLGNGLLLYPEDVELLTNLATCYSRNHQYEQAIQCAQQALKQNADDYYLWDILTISHYSIGQQDKARTAGTTSLMLKDKKHGHTPEEWLLPNQNAESLTNNKKKVIAFSLWGDKERYLHGTLRNLQSTPEIYPGWEVWVYHDNSIPKHYQYLMKQLGAKLIKQLDNQSIKQKTCWRFSVASTSSVGYFMIRDADSVISEREKKAVDAWLESGKLFHIIRDWWTHTDLILAGMWGGVAGILPNIQPMVTQYSARHLETPNIDQWFLRDIIWPLIKPNCLIHDRCFQAQHTIPVPGALPEGKFHIGCCEYTLFRKIQKEKLASILLANQSSGTGFKDATRRQES
ncbi:MAG: tetratricopeptide repeat protein [Endozoicomonas sp.]